MAREITTEQIKKYLEDRFSELFQKVSEDTENNDIVSLSQYIIIEDLLEEFFPIDELA